MVYNLRIFNEYHIVHIRQKFLAEFKGLSSKKGLEVGTIKV